MNSKLELEETKAISVPNETSTMMLLDKDTLTIDSRPNVHIPYILNGELYEIQSQQGENVTVKCCNCPPDRLYRGSVRSTGNFHMHIKRRHPELLMKLNDMKVRALLDRRERFIKNRKPTPTPTNRSRHPIKYKLSPRVSSSPLHLHTHKLKIKRAYQKHQQQQLEQQQQQRQILQNWNDGPYIDTPIPAPLNYSLKEAAIQPEVVDAAQEDTSSTPCSQKLTEQLEKQFVPVTSSQLCGDTIHDEHDPDNAIVPSSPISSDSMSSCDDTVHSLACTVGLRNSAALVKREEESLFVDQAIDLTIPSDNLSSGIGSSSSQNRRNLENTSITNSTQNITENVDTFWQTLVLHLNSSLRGIQQEICVRNRIEAERILLDIAKFKHLYPEFDFNFRI